MVVDAMIRAAAVGGVASMWFYFTLKTLKICEKIIFPLDKIYLFVNCSHSFTRGFLSEKNGVNCHFYECKNCENCEDPTVENSEKKK